MSGLDVVQLFLFEGLIAEGLLKLQEPKVTERTEFSVGRIWTSEVFKIQ